MAQFVTHIQPTLVEASQGHMPHHHSHQVGLQHQSHLPHSGHNMPSPPTHNHYHIQNIQQQQQNTQFHIKSQNGQQIKMSHDNYTSHSMGDGNTSFLRAARAGNLEKVLEHLKNNIDINTSNNNGLNALHLASKDGHIHVVSELLKRGAIVDSATKKGNTALHIASLAGQEEVVSLLLQSSASVNVQSQNGFTPLYMAAQENHDKVVKLLLANGANQSLATEDGFTPLAVAMQQGHDKVVAVLLESDTRGKVRLPALHIAAKKDDVKAASLLLENDHNPDITSKSGFTPLHIASHYGNQSIANLLIQKGADVNYLAKHNISPLHVAAKWGKTNMVSLLLEKGANIEAKTRDGLTPLHCAARSGHEQVVDMLLERGAPISAKTKNGLAPLHMAAQGEHVDAARILLYHRAPVDEVTVDYLTALHVAAHCGHVRVAKLLLDRSADANARALNGFTPLHIACKKNRIKVVELLLRHGASISATTESGLTPLHVAAFMGCMNIVIYLLQHDASPDVPTVRGETPLHLAARANQTDIIRILLRNGAQVDARAREQQTPLHIAARLGNVDIVMLLLQHGAQVDATTKDMYTALHIAAKEGQDEVCAVLIENGAALDSSTKKGFTPLHLAAKYGHMKVAQLLLQKDAHVDAQGKNGVTPLHVACHYDKQNVALLLLERGASPHAPAKNGHTPLHIAARKNQMDIATTLLEYGAYADTESKAGFTPLHLSSQEGHAELSNLLIEHKANCQHAAKNGLTPMHLCAQEDNVNVAEILMKNGADINMVTKAGYTPLHVASHFGQSNMVRFLLQNSAAIDAATSIGYTSLHQAAQQGHCHIVNLLLEHKANANAQTANGQTPLHIAKKLGYISVLDSLKSITGEGDIDLNDQFEDKYRVVAPEAMHETFMSDSEEEGGEDNALSDQPYRYLTVDEMKSLGDDSLPFDVTRDERIDSNRIAQTTEIASKPPIMEIVSPHKSKVYAMTKQSIGDANVQFHDSQEKVQPRRKLQWKNFLVSFLVDARGGALRGCRHSGVKMIIPSRSTCQPTRITCRYVKPQRTMHPPQLMEGEALASRVLELGPVSLKFQGPIIMEVPHFASLRGKEREIIILRSDNGETWREHTIDNSEEIMADVLSECFEPEDVNQLNEQMTGYVCRFVTYDFPQYFAVVSRVRQEVHAIGSEGGMVSSTVVPQVQAVFPQGALTKKIKVGLQAQPIDPDLTAKLLGRGVAVSPIVTVEPRRRKFHKAITLSMPAPKAHSQGMINQYSGNTPTLRLLCSITGGASRAQWEDVTGSTPLTFVNECVSFTTTVSARFWLMDCRNISEATKMATELYREVIHVPFMAKFVVFAKRIECNEAKLRVFCMTDDKEDKTLEKQEQFIQVAKSRDVEVLEGKPQFIEMAGNLVPVTKSGDQLQLMFKAFRENRLPFTVRVKDQHADIVGRTLFMKDPKIAKGEPPQHPICILNIILPEIIVQEQQRGTSEKSISDYLPIDSNGNRYIGNLRIVDLSNLLGKDYIELGLKMGVTLSNIDAIVTRHPNSIARQAQDLIHHLKENEHFNVYVLEDALKEIGREDILEKSQITQNIHHDSLPEDKQSIDYSQSSTMQGIREREEIKYSAEEKDVEESESDDDNQKRTVAERREKIVKRLSVERQIPASSQKKEIVQEITEIKRRSLIEDKKAIHEEEIMMQMPTDNSVKTSDHVKIKFNKGDTEVLKSDFDRELICRFKTSLKGSDEDKSLSENESIDKENKFTTNETIRKSISIQNNSKLNQNEHFETTTAINNKYEAPCFMQHGLEIDSCEDEEISSSIDPISKLRNVANSIQDDSVFGTSIEEQEEFCKSIEETITRKLNNDKHVIIGNETEEIPHSQTPPPTPIDLNKRQPTEAEVKPFGLTLYSQVMDVKELTDISSHDHDFFPPEADRKFNYNPDNKSAYSMSQSINFTSPNNNEGFVNIKMHVTPNSSTTEKFGENYENVPHAKKVVANIQNTILDAIPFHTRTRQHNRMPDLKAIEDQIVPIQLKKTPKKEMAPCISENSYTNLEDISEPVCEIKCLKKKISNLSEIRPTLDIEQENKIYPFPYHNFNKILKFPVYLKNRENMIFCDRKLIKSKNNVRLELNAMNTKVNSSNREHDNNNFPVSQQNIVSTTFPVNMNNYRIYFQKKTCNQFIHNELNNNNKSNLTHVRVKKTLPHTTHLLKLDSIRCMNFTFISDCQDPVILEHIQPILIFKDNTVRGTTKQVCKKNLSKPTAAIITKEPGIQYNTTHKFANTKLHLPSDSKNNQETQTNMLNRRKNDMETVSGYLEDNLGTVSVLENHSVPVYIIADPISIKTVEKRIDPAQIYFYNLLMGNDLKTILSTVLSSNMYIPSLTWKPLKNAFELSSDMIKRETKNIMNTNEYNKIICCNDCQTNINMFIQELAPTPTSFLIVKQANNSHSGVIQKVLQLEDNKDIKSTLFDVATGEDNIHLIDELTTPTFVKIDYHIFSDAAYIKRNTIVSNSLRANIVPEWLYSGTMNNDNLLSVRSVPSISNIKQPVFKNVSKIVERIKKIDIKNDTKECINPEEITDFSYSATSLKSDLLINSYKTALKAVTDYYELEYFDLKEKSNYCKIIDGESVIDNIEYNFQTENLHIEGEELLLGMRNAEKFVSSTLADKADSSQASEQHVSMSAVQKEVQTKSDENNVHIDEIFYKKLTCYETNTEKIYAEVTDKLVIKNNVQKTDLNALSKIKCVVSVDFSDEIHNIQTIFGNILEDSLVLNSDIFPEPTKQTIQPINNKLRSDMNKTLYSFIRKPKIFTSKRDSLHFSLKMGSDNLKSQVNRNYNQFSSDFGHLGKSICPEGAEGRLDIKYGEKMPHLYYKEGGYIMELEHSSKLINSQRCRLDKLDSEESVIKCLPEFEEQTIVELDVSKELVTRLIPFLSDSDLLKNVPLIKLLIDKGNKSVISTNLFKTEYAFYLKNLDINQITGAATNRQQIKVYTLCTSDQVYRIDKKPEDDIKIKEKKYSESLMKHKCLELNEVYGRRYIGCVFPINIERAEHIIWFPKPYNLQVVEINNAVTPVSSLGNRKPIVELGKLNTRPVGCSIFSKLANSTIINSDRYYLKHIVNGENFNKLKIFTKSPIEYNTGNRKHDNREKNVYKEVRRDPFIIYKGLSLVKTSTDDASANQTKNVVQPKGQHRKPMKHNGMLPSISNEIEKIESKCFPFSPGKQVIDDDLEQGERFYNDCSGINNFVGNKIGKTPIYQCKSSQPSSPYVESSPRSIGFSYFSKEKSEKAENVNMKFSGQTSSTKTNYKVSMCRSGYVERTPIRRKLLKVTKLEEPLRTSSYIKTIQRNQSSLNPTSFNSQSINFSSQMKTNSDDIINNLRSYGIKNRFSDYPVTNDLMSISYSVEFKQTSTSVGKKYKNTSSATDHSSNVSIAPVKNKEGITMTGIKSSLYGNNMYKHKKTNKKQSFTTTNSVTTAETMPLKQERKFAKSQDSTSAEPFKPCSSITSKKQSQMKSNIPVVVKLMEEQQTKSENISLNTKSPIGIEPDKKKKLNKSSLKRSYMRPTLSHNFKTAILEKVSIISCTDTLKHNDLIPEGTSKLKSKGKQHHETKIGDKSYTASMQHLELNCKKKQSTETKKINYVKDSIISKHINVSTTSNVANFKRDNKPTFEKNKRPSIATYNKSISKESKNTKGGIKIYQKIESNVKPTTLQPNVEKKLTEIMQNSNDIKVKRNDGPKNKTNKLNLNLQRTDKLTTRSGLSKKHATSNKKLDSDLFASENDKNIDNSKTGMVTDQATTKSFDHKISTYTEDDFKQLSTTDVDVILLGSNGDSKNQEFEASFIDTTDSSLSDSVALSFYALEHDKLYSVSPGSPKPTKDPLFLIEEQFKKNRICESDCNQQMTMIKQNKISSEIWNANNIKDTNTSIVAKEGTQIDNTIKDMPQELPDYSSCDVYKMCAIKKEASFLVHKVLEESITIANAQQKNSMKNQFDPNTHINRQTYKTQLLPLEVSSQDGSLHKASPTLSVLQSRVESKACHTATYNLNDQQTKKTDQKITSQIESINENADSFNTTNSATICDSESHYIQQDSSQNSWNESMSATASTLADTEQITSDNDLQDFSTETGEGVTQHDLSNELSTNEDNLKMELVPVPSPRMAQRESNPTENVEDKLFLKLKSEQPVPKPRQQQTTDANAGKDILDVSNLPEMDIKRNNLPSSHKENETVDEYYQVIQDTEKVDVMVLTSEWAHSKNNKIHESNQFLQDSKKDKETHTDIDLKSKTLNVESRDGNEINSKEQSENSKVMSSIEQEKSEIQTSFYIGELSSNVITKSKPIKDEETELIVDDELEHVSMVNKETRKEDKPTVFDNEKLDAEIEHTKIDTSFTPIQDSKVVRQSSETRNDLLEIEIDTQKPLKETVTLPENRLPKIGNKCSDLITEENIEQNVQHISTQNQFASEDAKEIDHQTEHLIEKTLPKVSKLDLVLDKSETELSEKSCTKMSLENIASENYVPDVLLVERTLEEVQQSLDAAKEELIQVVRDGKSIKQSPSEFEFRNISHQKSYSILHEDDKSDNNIMGVSSIILDNIPEANSQSDDMLGSADSSVHDPVAKSVNFDQQAPQESLSPKTQRWSLHEGENSSSSESYYKSSSRPCSSDFDNLHTIHTSSEYQTALDASICRESTEYVSAISSLDNSGKTLSSHESMRSFSSDISGNLGSIDTSDLSETLVASAGEQDEEIEMEGRDEELFQDDSNLLIDDSSPKSLMDYETQHSMKRSQEMIFTIEEAPQSSPRNFTNQESEMEAFVETLHSAESKILASSLEENSILSTSTISAVDTVIHNFDDLIGSAGSSSLICTEMCMSINEDDFNLVTFETQHIKEDMQVSLIDEDTQVEEENKRADSATVYDETITNVLADSEKVLEDSEVISNKIILDDSKGSESESDQDPYESEYSRAFKSPTQRKKRKEKKHPETLEENSDHSFTSLNLVTETIIEDTVTEEIESQISTDEIRLPSQNMQDYSNIPNIMVTEDVKSEIEADECSDNALYKVKTQNELHKVEDTPIQRTADLTSTITDEQFNEIIQQQYKQKLADITDSGESDFKAPDSPDSFEMVDQPDLTDEFVIIEEVAKEANELDTEGKSIKIRPAKTTEHHDVEVEQILIKSAPAATNLGSQIFKDDLNFDFEESPPSMQSQTDVESAELIANKKWVEMQLSDNAQLRYPYELERGILEDIKEEDAEFEVGSSRISSFKDSFSSTPEYDVLAGRKYFTKNDHDDISMNSLQEFENLEHAISLENRKGHQGSTDSSSGSFTRRIMVRNACGDDISLSSLKEFEGLENACVEAHLIEIKAKEEAALLLSRSDESSKSNNGNEYTPLSTNVSSSANVSQLSSSSIEVKLKSKLEKCEEPKISLMEISTDSLEGEIDDQIEGDESNMSQEAVRISAGNSIELTDPSTSVAITKNDPSSITCSNVMTEITTVIEVSNSISNDSLNAPVEQIGSNVTNTVYSNENSGLLLDNITSGGSFPVASHPLSQMKTEGQRKEL